MATTTIAEAVLAVLTTNWTLAAPLAVLNIHFDTGWLDREWTGATDAALQIIVTYIGEGPINYFGRVTTASLGHHLLGYLDYVVNVWVRIPAGVGEGNDQLYLDYAERLRWEVVDLLNHYGCSVADPTSVGSIFPLGFGRAIHELDITPRILRFEIPVLVWYQRD